MTSEPTWNWTSGTRWRRWGELHHITSVLAAFICRRFDNIQLATSALQLPSWRWSLMRVVDRDATTGGNAERHQWDWLCTLWRGSVWVPILVARQIALLSMSIGVRCITRVVVDQWDNVANLLTHHSQNKLNQRCEDRNQSRATGVMPYDSEKRRMRMPSVVDGIEREQQSWNKWLQSCWYREPSCCEETNVLRQKYRIGGDRWWC